MSAINDELLQQLAAQVGAVLVQRGLMLASAESCTGGWLGQTMTSVAGSSTWYERGFITYTNVSKSEMLGVSDATLAQHGAVSEQTAKEMVLGTLARSHAQIAVSITGIAGPGGGTVEKPVGMVCFAWAMKDGLAHSETRHFTGDRETVRHQSVAVALQGVQNLLQGAAPVVA